MKLTRKFECAEHPEYGGLGWRPMWVHGTLIEPLGGMGAAHDILEHPTSGFAGAEGEFMACGGMLLVRAEGGYWSGNYNRPPIHISSDIPDILQRVVNDEETLLDPGRTSRLDEEWIEDDIEEAVERGWMEAETDREVDVGRLPPKANHRIHGWMRRGYRAARRRFGHIPARALTDAFSKIEKQADQRLKWAYAGCFLTVHVSFDDRYCPDVRTDLNPEY